MKSYAQLIGLQNFFNLCIPYGMRFLHMVVILKFNLKYEKKKS